MNGTDEITNSQDVIDSRDVIARIEYLESLETVTCPNCEGDSADDTAAPGCCDECKGVGTIPGEIDDSERDELKALQAFADEAEGYAADWMYGETLIRDSYFEDYAQELAEDIGAVNRDASWPNTCIDWKQAARELQTDYSAVDFDGVTYWTR